MASKIRLRKLREELARVEDRYVRASVELAALVAFRIPRGNALEGDRATLLATLEDLRARSAARVRESYAQREMLRSLIESAELSASDRRLDGLRIAWERRIDRYIASESTKL